MMPLAGASISIVALLVSISKISVPSRTSSPSFTCQAAIMPSVMSMSTRGRITSVGISSPPAKHAPRRRDNIVDLRHRGFFKLGVIRQRAIGAAQPDDRRVEIIEGLAFARNRCDFRADPQLLDAFIHADQPRCLPNA